MNIPKNGHEADYVYKDTDVRNLELTFLPPLTEKYELSPVYFLVPGGGWHMEKKQDMLDFSSISVEALRKEGFSVVGIDYRICHEGAKMQDILADCFDAAHYIAHFADVLKIDKNKFFMSGHSAGGHLALMLSYAKPELFKDDYEFDDEFKVVACAPLSPPTILYDNSTHGLNDLADVFDAEDFKEMMKKTSPVTYVSKSCPPTLLMAGTSDYLVYPKSSEKLCDMLKENGVECELILSLGGGHCYEKMHKDIEPSVSAEKMQEYVTEFILNHIGE